MITESDGSHSTVRSARHGAWRPDATGIRRTQISQLSDAVTLLRPLDVRLLGENQPLSAASEYEVACQSSGARPPASISWWKAGVLLDHTRETTSPDGNVTTSTLTFSPQVDDSGKALTCRAENKHISGSAQEDTWTLNVHYSPVVTLELGSNLNGSSIREGVDVYFECNIQANPWVYKVIWRHNGQPLHNNASTGVILSNQTLVLQSVSRNISGLYTCVGSNSEGDSESNPFNLDVKYEPVCSAGQQRVYGAARFEEVSVVCDVDANPPAGLFRWSFNNSAVQSLELFSVTSEPGGGRSVATYKPTSERDYGTLLCWGRNELGSQAVPCVFHVVPAGKPDAPRTCTTVNRTSTSVQVNCAKGFDGGLPQEFTMELYAAARNGGSNGHRRLVSNITSRSKPEFTVTGLEPGAGYFVSVYASNGKGRSPTFTLSMSTLKSTHQEHRRTTVATSFPAFPQVTPVLWVLAGIVVTLGVVGLAAVIALRVRGGMCGDCFEQDDDDQHTSTGSPESLTDPGAKVAAASTGNLLTVSLQGVKGPVLVTAEEMDDRNPDVIPHTTDMEYPTVEYKSYDKLSVDSGGRPFSVETQPTKSVSYGNIPHYSRTASTETVRFEAQPVRWQHLPGSHQTVTTATQTHNAETQTPLLVRHKESAV
ncbi:neural cell adhesion molecule 2-like [Periplaneta americana]|uniref:neural cell adhesion molecule 2-like n=1 Tax=Periplaneta americana TaxID=6978 RepID=UPI0037E843F6